MMALAACSGGSHSSASDTSALHVGGTVTGLVSGTSVELDDNGAAAGITANGTYNFPTALTSGSSYDVTVAQQPAGASCVVTNGSGTIGSSSIGNVLVTCTPKSFTINGVLSGLLSGRSLTLQDNGGDSMTVTAGGNFSFATPVASGSNYAVTIMTQPAGQSCSVTNGSGMISAANITNVAISCSDNTYNVAVSVTGVASGGLVLQNNGTNDLAVSASGTLNFNTPLASGSTYAVTVASQPLGGTCTVGNGAGTIIAASVSVTVSCVANLYSVSGAVTGLLSGRSVTLQSNGANSTPVSANGTFNFSAPVASGSNYSVTVFSQPSGQSCSVTNGSGMVAGSAIGNISIACSSNTYNVGVAVSGVIRTGLVLQNNGGDNLNVAADGSYNFATAVPSGSPYVVTLLTQPAGENCALANAGGTIVASNVVGISVVCTPINYSIGGAVTGLLANNSVVLRDNGGNDTTVSANGSYTFSGQIASGSPYAVTVPTQPPGQNCTVTNGSGTVLSNNVAGVNVSCSDNTYNIGVTLSGLIASGLVLQDNAGDNLTISANGSVNFATPIASGSGYSVTVLTQPSGENCAITSGNGSGTVTSGNVAVAIACSANNFTVGGTVSGLLSGNSVTLEDNAGNDTTVSSNSGFTFSASVASGSTYAVTVPTQPPGQNCSVTNGSGTIAAANITNVAVACSDNTYNIGVTVSGLTGSGLVLQDNAGDNLTISSNGSVNFATPIASGSNYAVTVLSQPTGQTCTPSNGSGTVASSNVSGIPVSCTTAYYSVGVTVSGLASGSVVFQDNGGDNLTISSNGSMNFATSVASGSAYNVTVLTQPSGQSCSVSSGNGSGTVTSNISVAVACSANTYTIGGTVSGLLSGNSVTLEDNGGNDTTVSAGSGGFTFTTPVASGSTYVVTVSTLPPGQSCTTTHGSGTVAAANITNVTVACSDNTYTIGVTVSGLTGTGLVLQDNAGDNLSISASGSATFATSVASGSPYAVSVFSQPTGQTCTVSSGSGSGTVTSANVTGIPVSCTASATTYSIGGTVSGLTSGSLVLQDNGTDNLTISANGSFTFATAIAPSGTYAVTASTQPAGETCLIDHGSGSVSAANVTNVNVTCGYLWTWVSGSTSIDAAGVYGTQQTASPNNVPGARYYGSSWTDASGNFWLFGGYGFDSQSNQDYLNDLWKFNPTARTWDWVNGSQLVDASGTYGTRGTASLNNVPGAREGTSSWTDASGNLWLFGGFGYDASSGNQWYLNDLWKFNPSAGTWEWVSGSSSGANATAVYGTRGTPSSSNVPGGREFASSWTDASGNLWLFGGFGVNGFGLLNDLWKFNPSAGTWEWVSGSNSSNVPGIYGTRGVASAANAPGTRHSASTWIDASGNLWLFGGLGYDSSAPNYFLNDLWKFNPTAGTWEWVSGSDTGDMNGVYGVLGTASTGNVPGSRNGATSWTDASGNMWLFGGSGFDGSGNQDELNDLWKFNPSAETWVWVSGSDAIDAHGIYGTRGTASPGNVPGARDGALPWIDSSGNLWLFGGSGFDGSGNFDQLNDLWMFAP